MDMVTKCSTLINIPNAVMHPEYPWFETIQVHWLYLMCPDPAAQPCILPVIEQAQSQSIAELL